MTALKNDTLLAGGPADFLAARHLRLEGTDREIGRALATIARDRLGVRKTPWTDPAATRAHRRWLQEHWPAQHERTLGVAEAFDIAPDDDRFDLSFLFYHWTVPGCSNVFVPAERTASGHATLLRNYDFTTGTVFELMGLAPPPGARPATCSPFVVESRSPGGHACLYTTSYELLAGCVDGVNEHGLAVALLSSVEVMRGPGRYQPRRVNGVGLQEIQLPRFLLETCRDAAEARRALAALPQYYQDVPCHYIVADRGGDAFVWGHAASPEAPIWASAEPGRPLAITNHLPARVLAPGPERAESEARLARLERALAAAGERPDAAALRGVAASVAATLPAGAGQYRGRSVSRTLWHAQVDLEERAVTIDFYLGDGPDGAIRRSPPRRLALSQTR